MLFSVQIPRQNLNVKKHIDTFYLFFPSMVDSEKLDEKRRPSKIFLYFLLIAQKRVMQQ